jgi:hypothetical protein
MLYFSELGRYGRLGNQLFQYASLKGIAAKCNLKPAIPELSNKNWHGQRCLLDEFRLECDRINEESVLNYKVVVEPNPPGYFHPSIEKVTDKTNLFGFFQNTKYFEHIQPQICKELTPRQEHIDSALDYISSISEGKQVVSLHIRRGDITDGTNGEMGLFGEDPLDTRYAWGKYFDKCSREISRMLGHGNYRFLIFVGGSRTGDDSEDIRWAKKYFGNTDLYRVSDSNDPIADFTRIMNCQHNILSPASSFGWWAAYLNTNLDKIVLCPQDYHLDNTTRLRDGFYPKEWIQI